MKRADWDSLCEKIVRPGIEKHLVPLMLYRGTRGFGWMHRRWNFAIQCMESEVMSFTEAIAMSRNPDFAHLCHAIKQVDHDHLGSVFGRLLDNPHVTNNVKGLTEYVREVEGIKHKLTPVSLYANAHGHPERVSPWRIPVKSTGRRRREDNNLVLPMAETVEFPFMLNRPGRNWESSLLKDVHAIVPRSFPKWLRADVCQDLVADILGGQIPAEDLKIEAHIIVERVMKLHPVKYGHVPTG